MAFTVPGGQNTFVPTLDLSGNLLVQFGRNVAKFPVNKIVRHRPVKKETGLYRYFNPLDYARFASGGTAQFDWPHGTPAPTGNTNLIQFENRSFQTRRKNYPCDLDLDAEQQADWDVLKSQTEAAAQLAMTARAFEVAAAVTLSSNYPSSHVDTATNWGGGFFQSGSSTSPYIKIGFMKLANQIHLDSGANVNPNNLCVVMNPNTARKIAVSAEIIDYVKYGMPGGYAFLTGEKLNPNERWGLPDRLYGFPVIVEDTTYNSYNRNDPAPETLTYVFPDNQIAMVCREEQMIASEQANSYSTFHLFVYSPEDMKVESETDNWNRLIKLRVMDNFQVLAVAGVTGGLINNVNS